MNLFGENDEVIRTLGFYQPYGSLMLHGKIETRKVRVNKKPPFPCGKYLFYTTQIPADQETLLNWSGHFIEGIEKITRNESTIALNGYAIGIGVLKKLWIMKDEDEEKCFVNNEWTPFKTNWCLGFENVHRIIPFEFKFGKQGVGILRKSEYEKINLVNKINSLT
jgi:hypothetical protein